MLDTWTVGVALLATLQIALAIGALYDLWGRKTVRYLGKPIWVVVIVIFNIFGPLAYFVLGRGK